MRVAIPHDLSREEVRQRLHNKSDMVADSIPGMAQVEYAWADVDTMKMAVGMMGQTIDCTVLVEDAQLVIDVNLPLGLAFVRRMIEPAIREKGARLLA